MDFTRPQVVSMRCMHWTVMTQFPRMVAKMPIVNTHNRQRPVATHNNPPDQLIKGLRMVFCNTYRTESEKDT